MRKIFGCGCCADSDVESTGEYDSKLDVGSDISWSTAQPNKEYDEQKRSTLPTIVVTQPSGADEKPDERMSIGEFVDVDFRQGNYEADRFSDMSATIFKRHS